MNKTIALFLSLTLLTVAVTGCNGGPGPTSTEASPPTLTEEPTPVEDTDPWEIILQMKVEQQADAAGFISDVFGITLSREEINYTTDGGATWTRSNWATGTDRGLDIVNEQVAWGIGNAQSGEIQVSTDGAQNWQAVSRVTYLSAFISFLDAQTGWAASPNNLWATTDGAQTWEEITLPEDITTISGISLRTASSGYFLDGAGILYVTQDGGASWSSQTLGLDKDVLINPTSPYVAIRFFDADHGVIVLSLAGGGGNLLALRTADGGQTWEQEDVPAKMGTLHLSHDGTILTILDTRNGVTVLRYQGD